MNLFIEARCKQEKAKRNIGKKENIGRKIKKIIIASIGTILESR